MRATFTIASLMLVFAFSMGTLACAQQNQKDDGQKNQKDTERPNGTERAIDKLALEILSSLRKKNTLAIWLIDRSPSMKKRRETIADRFAHVQKQVDGLKVGDDRWFKTAVACFGERTEIITPKPVDDATEVADAIRNIASDSSGKEYVAMAIEIVTRKWLPYRRTKSGCNIMVIIVTDERGDDHTKLNKVADNLVRNGIRVYCVGNASVFGREKGYVAWEYDDGFKEELPVDQGPECVKADRLKLPFWGGDNDHQKYERLSSGYGPYGLSRLCAESGGVYYLAEQGSIQFKPDIMRDYQPDYRSIPAYKKDVDANLAKSALIQACDQTRQVSFRLPPLRFQANNTALLRTQIIEAQKLGAKFDAVLNELLVTLMRGEMDRTKTKEPRWRASYDLAMGRVLAMRVRAHDFNRLLAEMKSQPKQFKEKESKFWTLKSSGEINAGPNVKKLANLAKMYLTRVIDEHPSTPWAMIAKRELGQPMGWQWAEGTGYTTEKN